MDPIEVFCGTCEAEPGDGCTTRRGRAFNPSPTGRQKFHASRRKFALAAGRRCLVCDARVGQPCVGIMGDSAGKPIATPHFRRMYPGAAWGAGGKSDV